MPKTLNIHAVLGNCDENFDAADCDRNPQTWTILGRDQHFLGFEAEKVQPDAIDEGLYLHEELTKDGGFTYWLVNVFVNDAEKNEYEAHLLLKVRADNESAHCVAIVKAIIETLN